MPAFLSSLRSEPRANEVIKFNCNLCGGSSSAEWGTLLREGPSCSTCGSSVRQREVVNAVEEILRADKKVINVIGLSDSPQIETYFKSHEKVNYTNTFIDTDPLLDISAPALKWADSADVLISSDVFEHVFFPISKSLCGSFKILKNGGYIIITMPWNYLGPSIEHYPWMVSYEV